MKIAFVSALLLGLAAARTKLMSWTGSYDMISTSLLTISGEYDADLGYDTGFGFEEDGTNALLWTASYYASIDSSISYDMTFNFADVFTYNVEVDLTLFDFTPLTQYITYTRPDAILYDNTQVYEVVLTGERDLEFGTVSVYHTPDTLVTDVSFYDAWASYMAGTTLSISDFLPTTSAQWALQDDSDVSITDSYLTYNFAEDFLGLDSTVDTWYGTQTWYTTTFSL
jgi:hypothetical protein